MKKNPLFNPIPLPEDLNLNPQAAAAGVANPSGTPGHGAPGQAAPKASKRQTKGASKAKASRPKSSRRKKKPTFQQIKDFIESKLGSLDAEKLKQVLRACGIAAGIITAVIMALKFFPLGALLLALLTTAAAMRLWDRLSHMGSIVL